MYYCWTLTVTILTYAVSNKSSHESSISCHRVAFELNKYRMIFNYQDKGWFGSTLFRLRYGLSLVGAKAFGNCYKKKSEKKRLLLWTIHIYLDHTPAWVSKNFAIYLIFLCLSLFTVLFLYAVSFLGCFVARDFCRSGFRQNFVNFYLFTPPARPPWSFPVPTQNSITVIDRLGLGLVFRVRVSGQG